MVLKTVYAREPPAACLHRRVNIIIIYVQSENYLFSLTRRRASENRVSKRAVFRLKNNTHYGGTHAPLETEVYINIIIL